MHLTEIDVNDNIFFFFHFEKLKYKRTAVANSNASMSDGMRRNIKAKNKYQTNRKKNTCIEGEKKLFCAA